MIDKSAEKVRALEIQPAARDANRSSLLPPVLCAIAYVLCVLLMVAPLSRILDPVIRLRLPFGGWLEQVGAWLPINLGLSANLVASQTTTSTLEFLGLVTLSLAICGLCALYITRLPSESQRYGQTRLLLLAGTLLAGLIFVFTPAMLSHDIIVYTGYSRLLAIYHANPYFVPLTAFPSDPYVPLNYWAGSIAAYGPLWLGVCGVIGFLVGTQVTQITGYILAFRLFALAAHLLNIWLVTRSLRAMRASPRTVTLGVLLYAWNPLVLLESSFGGHNDVFMLTFILLGIYLTARARQRGTLASPRGYLPPALALTLSALVKFTSLPVLALFLIFLACNILRQNIQANVEANHEQRPLDAIARLHSDRPLKAPRAYSWRAAIIAVVTAGATSGALALALYAPFWIGHSIKAIRTSFTSPPSSIGAENSLLRSIIDWSHSTSLPPAHTLASYLLYIFENRHVWDAINIVLLVLFLVLSSICMWRSHSVRTFTLSALAALGVVLIATPWFFSWYVTWLIGLAAVALPVRDSRLGSSLLAFALAFSLSALSIYIFLYGYPPFGIRSFLVYLSTIIPPLLAFLITFLTWRPAKDLHLSAPESVNP